MSFVLQTLIDILPPFLQLCVQYHVILDCVNTLRPRENGRHFADRIFKCIFLNGNVWIPITISLKFVPKGPINNIPALVQIMAWRRPGDKPLSEPMMVSLLTHICVTRPQWVKMALHCIYYSWNVQLGPQPIHNMCNKQKGKSHNVAKWFYMRVMAPQITGRLIIC